MQNTYLNGFDIRIEPFDMEYTGNDYKIDLLFYNNVNRYGEILTSLVYNSGIKGSSDITNIIYNPNKLYRNTPFEESYSIENSSNIWVNADLLYTGEKLLKDNSYSATYSYNHYNTATDFASKYGNGNYMYDGWYTLVSLSLQNYADVDPGVLVGTFRDNNGVAQYYYGSNIWRNLNDIDSTVHIYNFIREDRGEIYNEYNFFVSTKTYSMYKKLLEENLESLWFKRVNAIASKIRTIETAVELNKYDKAQHMINSMDNSLLSFLI